MRHEASRVTLSVREEHEFNSQCQSVEFFSSPLIVPFIVQSPAEFPNPLKSLDDPPGTNEKRMEAKDNNKKDTHTHTYVETHSGESFVRCCFGVRYVFNRKLSRTAAPLPPPSSPPVTIHSQNRKLTCDSSGFAD